MADLFFFSFYTLWGIFVGGHLYILEVTFLYVEPGLRVPSRSYLFFPRHVSPPPPTNNDIFFPTTIFCSSCFPSTIFSVPSFPFRPSWLILIRSFLEAPSLVFQPLHRTYQSVTPSMFFFPGDVPLPFTSIYLRVSTFPPHFERPCLIRTFSLFPFFFLYHQTEFFFKCFLFP